MNVFLQLIKITMSNVEPSIEEKKRSKIFGVVVAILIILLLFVPICGFTALMVYALTDGISTLQASNEVYAQSASAITAGLSMILHIVALFSFIFGFNVIMSVFYFSSDLEYLLPLPISPMKIVGAKLASTMISENVMECLLVISALIGFMVGYGFDPPVGSGLNIVSFLAMIIGVVTFPVLPICCCAVICMIVMAVSRVFKNKDRVSKATQLSTVVILLALVILMQVTGGFNPDTFVENLVNGNFKVFGILDKIFVTVPLLSSALAGSVLSLLLYILVNAAAVGLVLLCASKLYFKAVVSLNNGQGKAKSTEKEYNFDKKVKQSRPTVTYLKKELKILFRTPAYLMNCLGINLIWPVFIYLFVVMQKQNAAMSGFIDQIRNGEDAAVVHLAVIVFAVSVILTSLNCIASSAITREGKHFDVMRYLPFSMMAQINAKALASIIISGGSLVVYITASFAIFGISVFLIGYSIMLSLLAVLFTTYLGIYIDTINPKLVWEDELNALRGNYHVFYNMGLELIITGALCGGIEYLRSIDFFPAAFLQSLLLMIAGLLCLRFYILCKEKGTKNLLNLEL